MKKSKTLEKIEKINPHLYEYYPQDYVLKYTFVPLIPRFIKPNHLTMLRYICTPFVLAILIMGNLSVGIPFFLVTAFTDMLDGSLARIRKQITNWGIVNDPIADKILIGSVTLVFVIKYLSPYIAFAIIFIEVISFVIPLTLQKARKVLPANIFGKLKMACQVGAVLMVMVGVLINDYDLVHFAPYIFYLSFVFAISRSEELV